MRNKLGYIVLVLLIAQLALILLSWLLTAAFPELPMRSMLSSEGIRWFFGSFVSNQLHHCLSLYMAVMAAGACIRSRLYTALRAMLSNVRSSPNKFHKQSLQIHYREKAGLRVALVEFIAYVIIMILLTAVPHAISPECDRTAIPQFLLLEFHPLIITDHHHHVTTYGVASGTIDSVAKMHKILVGGLEVGSRLVPTYLIGIQLYMSIRYVFIL